MKIRARLLVVIAVALAAAALSPARAGTTGTLIGYVATRAGAAITGASVTAASSAQTATVRTDGDGRFVFVSLAPDRYTLTVSKEGYRPALVTDVDVVADNAQTIAVRLEERVVTLATVTVRGATGLVRPGTTQDVYSINAQLQSRVAALGGGNNLDNAYSAIASVPGAFVPPDQSGWNQPVILRGGDFTEIGHELDGVPLNRAWDNIGVSPLSTLGQQELQVYTGAAPADAEAHGLSGYVNQVVKTGTYPGFGTLSLGIGSPAFYNKVNLEIGGATPDKRFSYFVGIGGYGQDLRYVDQTNGAAYSQVFGQPFDLQFALLGPLSPIGVPGCGLLNGSNFAGCYANHAYFNSLPVGPGGYVQGPFALGYNARINDHENIVNLHIAIPQGHNGLSDDVQLLFDSSQLYTYEYSSYFDWGGAAFWSGVDGPALGLHNATGLNPVFQSGFQYTGALGQAVSGIPSGPIAGVIPYLYPSENQYGFFGAIPGAQRDAVNNGQGIVKVQYQHAFGPSAYLRLYGYSYYANQFAHGPNQLNQFFGARYPVPPDVEIWSHTHGFAAEYTAQLNAANLLSLEGSYSTENTVSVDNEQMTNSTVGPPGFPPAQSAFAALVSTASPMSGVCYELGFGAPYPVSCEPTTPTLFPGTAIPAVFLAQKYLPYSGPFMPAPPGFEWLAVEGGPFGTTNTVTPHFIGAALQDQWSPNNRFHFNAGVRFDRFTFDLPPTADGAMRDFWFNVWNLTMCVNPALNGGTPIDETLLGLPVGAPCSLAPGFTAATMTNSTAAGRSVSFNEVQPRLGGTYTLGANDVLRFSYGGYAQPPQSEFEEYDTFQQNLADYIGPLFYQFGFTTPEHDVRPAVSYNADLSWEHRFPQTDLSLKLTPFYRRTRDEVQQLFADPLRGITSGVNAGRQTSYGLEFQLSEGDVTRDGLSAQLSYTYTYSRVRYFPLPNGTTLISPINSAIQLYNSFTSACAAAVPSTDPMSPCGVYGNQNAVATEINSVANPYFNAPAQPLFDPGGEYPPYHIVPIGTQLESASYDVPDFATLMLNYKRARLSVSPLFQFVAGSRYGAPEQQIGIDPSVSLLGFCSPLNFSGTVVGDPRYPFGGTGNPYDATTCPNTIVIPDQFTGKFDAPGAFKEPSFITAHVQFGYDASSRTTLRLTLSNLYTRCFGGDRLPWAVNNLSQTCGFDTVEGHIPPVGNIFNPGDPIQRLVQYPYGNVLTLQPFNAYFNVEIKL